jgi:CubicO group peptidase (beta-lactamase class C family)
MPKIQIISILLFTFITQWSMPLFCQSETNAFYQAERATVLLRDESGLIPLGGLDTLKVAYLKIGQVQDERFITMARKYMAIEEIAMPRAAQGQWEEQLKQDFNLVLLEIQDFPIGGQVPYAYTKNDIIKTLVRDFPSIVLINGDGSIFQVMPWLIRAKQLLIAPHRLDHAPQVAAQLIFGGLSAKGKLLGPINGTPFSRGDGMATAATRLGYTPAGYVNMDASLLHDNIKKIVEEGIQNKAFPGAQVLVARQGKVVYHEAFGFHTYEQSRPVRKDDLYDLASITKITGPLPALIQLHGMGRFELDAPLKQYLPAFRYSNKRKLTYRAMLAHHARLRPWIPYWQTCLKDQARYPWKPKWNKEKINDFNFRPKTFQQDSSAKYPIRITEQLWLHKNYKKKIYKAIRKSPLNEEAGYIYSGLIFYLLPEIIENITAQDYEQYVNEQFYAPLGATLLYNPLKAFPKERIVPTEKDTFFRMQLLHGTVDDEGAAMMKGVSGNAGLFGTANGLAKIMSLYLNEGYYGGEQLMDSLSVRTFTTCQYPEENNRRGLGFDKPLLEYDAEKSSVAEAASPASYGHAGFTGTFTWVDPEQDLIYIFLANRVHPSRTSRGIYEYDIRPRIHEVLYEAIKE